MKKIKFITFVLIGLCLTFITACKKNKIPPTVEFTSPVVQGDAPILRLVNISVNITTAGKKTIDKVEFFVDDELIPNGTLTKAPWDLVWECTDKFGQARVIKVVATDSKGIKNSSSMTVVVFNGVEKAKMPTPRYAYTSNVVNGKIYVIGGYNDDNTVFKVVEEYDPATDKWTTKASPPTGHAAAASCVINNIIYVFGGDRGYQWIPNVDAYNPATDTWTTKTPIPLDSNVAIGMSSATDANGKAYLMGGLAGVEPARVAEYDPTTDKWRLTKTYRRQYLAEAVTLNNTVYFFGGCPFRSMGFCDNASDSLLMYNVASDSWTAKKSLLFAHSGHASTVLNNKIYVFGGVTKNSSLPNRKSEVYDPTTNIWSSLTSLPSDMVNFSCNAVNGKIYLIGQDHVYEYTPD